MAVLSLIEGMKTVSDIISGVGKVLDNDTLVRADANGRIMNLINDYIVRPNILVDDRLKYLENDKFNSLIQGSTGIFTAFYLQAFNILVTIHDANPKLVVKYMNKSKNDIKDMMENFESYSKFLGSFDSTVGNQSEFFSKKELYERVAIYGLQDEELEDNVEDVEDNITPPVTPPDYNGIGGKLRLGRDVANKISEGIDEHYEQNSSDVRGIEITDVDKHKTNFYKSINFTISYKKDGKSTMITIPITIIPKISYINMNSLITTVTKDYDKSFKERFEEWRAGVISLSDLLFATDLIKKYKEYKVNIVRDKLNSLQEGKTGILDIVSLSPKTLGSGYNIYIVDKSFKPALDKVGKGNIYSDRHKELMMEKINAMIVNIVDVEDEKVIPMIDNIEGLSIVSIFNFGKLGKPDSDIEKLLKALLKNRSLF